MVMVVDGSLLGPYVLTAPQTEVLHWGSSGPSLEAPSGPGYDEMKWGRAPKRVAPSQGGSF